MGVAQSELQRVLETKAEHCEVNAQLLRDVLTHDPCNQAKQYPLSATQSLALQKQARGIAQSDSFVDVEQEATLAAYSIIGEAYDHELLAFMLEGDDTVYVVSETVCKSDHYGKAFIATRRLWKREHGLKLCMNVSEKTHHGVRLVTSLETVNV